MLRLKQFSLVSTHVLRRDYFKMIYISPNRPSGFCLDPKHTKLGSRHVNHFLFLILITVGQNQGSQYLNLINSRKWKNLSTSCQPQSKLNPLSPGVWILVITWGKIIGNYWPCRKKNWKNLETLLNYGVFRSQGKKWKKKGRGPCQKLFFELINAFWLNYNPGFLYQKGL